MRTRARPTLRCEVCGTPYRPFRDQVAPTCRSANCLMRYLDRLPPNWWVETDHEPVKRPHAPARAS